MKGPASAGWHDRYQETGKAQARRHTDEVHTAPI